MRSPIDPTGQSFPARSAPRVARLRTFDNRAGELISALRRAEAERAGKAGRGRRRKNGTGRPDLTRLRIAAVTGSFLSAVSSLGFCTLAFASHAEWPLIGVWTVSAIATATILAFFTALRRSLARHALELHAAHTAFCAALRGMAEEQVLNLEATHLLRDSRDDPELTNAILTGIVHEYTDAERSSAPDEEVDRQHKFSALVGKATKPANQNHPIARTLRRLASDVSADVSEAR
ncbi:hypothetical protein [Streptomyces sp. UNOC14_S4]|uniref:hypothetical protein n=1 Tax=Streptomyces sp. UNOC14_S4 TaxID=2872340 RepID=UPI001E2A0242|nr:hypothetical protein [Streptomyces sp. UNOC14_S4]MCC3770017.1 hypothetical protein [Streptomyces sp. UNOC14_S4]